MNTTNATNEKKTPEKSPQIKLGDHLICEVKGVFPLTLACQCGEKPKESSDSSEKPIAEKTLEAT